MRFKLFLLLSQLLNATCFDGDPDESLSARAWRQRDTGWARARQRIDRVLGEGHCMRVWVAQRQREKARS